MKLPRSSVDAEPSRRLQQPRRLGAQRSLGQRGELPQRRWRTRLNARQQSGSALRPAREPVIGLGVTAAHARPQTLHGALPQAVERQRRAVIARRKNELVTQVEPQPEPRLQVQVSSDPTGTQAAMLVGTELETALPIRQVDGVDAPPWLHRGFQDHDLQPGPREVARADQSVVPGADDDHVRSG